MPDLKTLFAPTHAPANWKQSLAPSVLLAVIYYCAARLGLALAFAATNATPVWPPSGIAFAALLLYGTRVWPGIAVGAFAANLAVFAANNMLGGAALIAVSLGIAAGNTLEALVGAFLFRQLIGDNTRIARPNNVYKFALIAALMSSVSASVGTACLLLGGIASLASLTTISWTWWLGDFTGALAITPAILALALPVVPAWPRRTTWESIAATLVLLGLVAAIFGTAYTNGQANRLHAFLLVPAIGWGAFRYGTRGVAIVLLLLTGGAVWGTTSGLGPFATGTLNDSLLTLAIYIALCSMIGLVLTADLSERRRDGGSPIAVADIAAHWGTLFFSLGLTVLAWHFIAASTESRAHDRFMYLAADIKQRIEERMLAYEQVLRSGKGLFSASDTVEAKDWYQFAYDLKIDLHYPGINGIGFAKRTSQSEIAGLEQKMRHEGFPDFKVWPDDHREEYTPVLYLSPLTVGNMRVLGYDMFSEPVRRSAMQKARDSGEPAISGKVTLVQEVLNDPQPGFLMYLPVYRTGTPTATVEQRRRALLGYVYSPFRMNDLMQGILGVSMPEVALEIHDGIGETDASRMYTSEPGLQKLRAEYPNSMSVKQTIPVEDRHWTLRVTSLPAFDASVDRQKSLIVLIAGTIISLLFFSVVRALSATRTEALALAREMTAALRESEVRFESLIESASDFAIVATDLSGIIRVFSIGAERMLGYSAAEVIGKHSPAIFHLDEEMQARARQLSEEANASIEGLAIFVLSARDGLGETREWTYVRKDGSRIPVQLTVSPIRGVHGEITGYVGIARNIAEERRTKEELRAAMLQAEQSSQAKSNFVANMSHELRTPMNAVLGMAYLMGNTQLTPDQRNYLDMIRASGQSLLGILNDILDFSKIEAGRMDLSPVRFRLADVLDAVTMIVGVNAGEKDLELALGVDPDVPEYFYGDSLRLQQVLVNLAGNAIKFTPRGEVSVLVELAGRHADGVDLRIRVRDTGIGMSEEQRKGLFAAFYQADSSTTRRFGGTGLGLAISSRLVEMMGGRIDVTSAQGKGSEFTVIVRLQAANGDDGTAERRNALPGLRLLVVDDNATSRECLRKAVAALGWRADLVEGGARALECIQQGQVNGEPYDAVLVDWKMPAMDGLTTVRAARDTWPKLDTRMIIMASAYARSELMGEDLPVHIDAFLTKPCTSSSLAAVVQEALRDSGRDAAASRRTGTEVRRIDGARFLLVEDNQMNQIVARSILEQAGATVEVADDGLKAISLLRGDPNGFDVILMDVQMPVMDGYAATRLIREKLELDLPVLAMTAGVMESERQECLACGMNDFIAKPVEVEQMLATIARHLPDRVNAAPATPADESGHSHAVFDTEQLTLLTSGDPVYRSAMVSLLQKVIDNGATDLHLALAAWREGRTEEATRLLHTMRGSIGSVGARRFAYVAMQLESAMHDGDKARVESLFDTTIQELEAALSEASKWVAQRARPAPANQGGTSQAAALGRLEALLSEQDMEAFDLYAELRPMLAERLPEHDMQILDRALDRLDFKAAFHCLKRTSGSFAGTE